MTVAEHMIQETGIEEGMMEEGMIAEEMMAETPMGEAMTGSLLAEVGQRRGRETILLVEDEAFVRKVAADVLESAGYSVLMARGPGEALQLLRTLCQPVDLLLSDVIMPGMSGDELAVQFRSLCPQGRILLMSGHVEQLDRCEVRFRGRKYLAKPFSMPVLLKTVRQALDLRACN